MRLENPPDRRKSKILTMGAGAACGALRMREFVARGRRTASAEGGGRGCRVRRAIRVARARGCGGLTSIMILTTSGPSSSTKLQSTSLRRSSTVLIFPWWAQSTTRSRSRSLRTRAEPTSLKTARPYMSTVAFWRQAFNAWLRAMSLSSFL